MMWAIRARKAAAALLFIAGFLWLLVTFAFTFLRYGLPPCESDEPVLWAMAGCAAGLIAGGGVMLVPRLRGLVRAALALGIPAASFAALYFVFTDNEARQAACAKRALSEAIEECGAVATHLRSGTSEGGYPTLTLVAPGSTDRAWDCLHRWARYADPAPSLIVDESVYTAYRAKVEAGRKTPAP
jgi:hypothetical protein